jgi:putative aldouronate transport system substrate-binding protein
MSCVCLAALRWPSWYDGTAAEDRRRLPETAMCIRKLPKTFVVLLIAIVSGCHQDGDGAGTLRTLSVEVFDRGVPGYVAHDNFMTQWIQERTQRELGLRVEFVPVPRGEEVEKLNLFMASGEGPDLVYTYSSAMMQSYVRNEGLTDLTELLPDYASNLQEYLGEDLLAYGQWEDRQWAIPAKRVFTGSHAAFIRQDWLGMLGLPVPTTLDEFYETLVAFRDQDPGRVGEDLVPLGITLDSNNIDWTFRLLVRSFITTTDPEDLACMELWTMPGYKEGIRYLNRLYNEGLVSPDFALDKDGQRYLANIVHGNTGCIIHNFDHPYRPTPGIATELAKNVPGARFVPFDAFPNFEGRHVKTVYNPNGLFVIVPEFSGNADIGMGYLDWMITPEVLFFLQNGNLGQQYRNVRNGIPVDFVPNDELPDDQKYNSTGDLSFVVNGREFGSAERNLEALAFGYPGYEREVREAMEIAALDGIRPFRFDVIIESETMYRSELDVRGAELLVKSVTCSPDEFDAAYDLLTAQYMAAGGAAIEAEKRAAYRSISQR